MAAKEGAFDVIIKKEEVVASKVPLQEHKIPMSNLDLLLPPLDVSVFICYNNPIVDSSGEKLRFGTMIGILKKALVQVLVPFYVFTGEVVQNTVNGPEILCNNNGVDFIEAFADVELTQLNLYNPDECVHGKLVPTKKHGVLSVQVTQLKCGGVVVACTFDHRIADAYSANMFLVSWANMAHSKPLTYFPNFQRSLLSPRCPVIIPPSLNSMYVPITALPLRKNLQPTTDDDNHLISRIYYVQASALDQLQTLASSGGYNRATKLESFSAFLWKLIAKCERKNNNNNNHIKELCKMGIVVDGRKRLLDNNDEKLMTSYFGNVLSIAHSEKQIDELIEKPLCCVAKEVDEFLKEAKTKEHFLGLIDWVEAHRPVLGIAKIYAGGSEDGPAFVVSSGQYFPISEVDFGWGKAVFGSYHFPWGGDTGYVMPMPSASGNIGDWVVYMHLFKGQLEFIEKEASHVFRPFSLLNASTDSSL